MLYLLEWPNLFISRSHDYKCYISFLNVGQCIICCSPLLLIKKLSLIPTLKLGNFLFLRFWFSIPWIFSPFAFISYLVFSILTSAESSPRTGGPGEDWRSAFDAAANGPTDYNDLSRSGSNGHSRRNSDPSQNGDVSSGSRSSSRRTPNRLPPAPPGSSYKY